MEESVKPVKAPTTRFAVGVVTAAVFLLIVSVGLNVLLTIDKYYSSEAASSRRTIDLSGVMTGTGDSSLNELYQTIIDGKDETIGLLRSIVSLKQEDINYLTNDYEKKLSISELKAKVQELKMAKRLYRYSDWFEKDAKQYPPEALEAQRKRVTYYLDVMRPVYERTDDSLIMAIFNNLSTAEPLDVLQMDTLVSGDRTLLGVLALAEGEEVSRSSKNFVGDVLGVYQSGINTITLKETGRFSPLYTAILGYHEGAHFTLGIKDKDAEHYQIIQLENKIADLMTDGAWGNIVDEYARNYVVEYGKSITTYSPSPFAVFTSNVNKTVRDFEKQGAIIHLVKPISGKKRQSMVYVFTKQAYACDSGTIADNRFIKLGYNHYMANPFGMYYHTDNVEGKEFWDKMKRLTGMDAGQEFSEDEMSQWKRLLALAVGIDFLKKKGASNDELMQFFVGTYND